MKQKLIVCALLASNLVYGQWSSQGATPNVWGNGAGPNVLQAWKSFGFGRFASYGAQPAARLHLSEHYLESPWTGVDGNLFRTDGSDAVFNQWELYTGAVAGSLSRKFRVFTATDNGTALNNAFGTLQNEDNAIVEASQRDLIFNAGGNTERMRILGQAHDLTNTQGNWFATAAAGNVGIGTPHPLSMLQIGGEASAGAGWRTWMRVGTYYASSGSLSGWDNMYVGLKQLGIDQHEAIISWGNNPSTNPSQADRLRFVFTAAPGNGIASSTDGLEVARMWANNSGDGRMGIGDMFTPNVEPQNTLEIRASNASPYWANPSGTSGLRMTFMSSNNTPMINPGQGVLSIDQNGDVIYVNAQASGTGYALCGSAPGAGNLTGDSYIGLNGNNFYFTGQAATNDRVGVGYDCNTLPAKLSVRSINGATIGIFSEVDFVSAGNTAGTFRANQGDMNTGVSGFGNGGQLTFGGYFSGFDSDDLNHGVYGTANGEGNYNFGVYGIAQNFTNGGTVNVGVYGEAQGPGTNYAGYFAGQVVDFGSSLPSDVQFKENILSLVDVSNVINNLNPVTFDFKTTGNAQFMHFDSSSQVGFIAQEVELILPELVKEITHPAKVDSVGNVVQNEFNYKTVSYEKLIPYLVADAKFKDSEIDSLKLTNQVKDSLINDLNDRLTTLENCLANILPALCNANNRAIEQTSEETQEALRAIIDVELRDGNTIILNQNVPNPFAERTVITYSIPQTVQKAQIHFYDGTGALINSVDISERGNGQLNVFANDLSSGTYLYTLVADGQVVSTKRMVKE